MTTEEQLRLFTSEALAQTPATPGFSTVLQGIPRAESAWAEAEKHQPRFATPPLRRASSAGSVAKKLEDRAGKAKLPTFAAQRDAILKALREAGWAVSGALKIPHATSPDGRARYWFKTQAIYGEGKGKKAFWDFHTAHSLVSDMRVQDARAMAAYLINRAPVIAEKWAFER